MSRVHVRIQSNDCRLVDCACMAFIRQSQVKDGAFYVGSLATTCCLQLISVVHTAEPCISQPCCIITVYMHTLPCNIVQSTMSAAFSKKKLAAGLFFRLFDKTTIHHHACLVSLSKGLKAPTMVLAHMPPQQGQPSQSNLPAAHPAAPLDVDVWR